MFEGELTNMHDVNVRAAIVRAERIADSGLAHSNRVVSHYFDSVGHATAAAATLNETAVEGTTYLVADPQRTAY